MRLHASPESKFAPASVGNRLGVGPFARVAVFRALQLGDMLCAVPALRALRAALPHAHITLIGLPWAGELARRFAHYVDDFIAFPGGGGLPERTASPAETAHFVTQTRAAGFDAVLQLHGSGEQSNPIVFGLGAPIAAGFHPPGTPSPDAERFVPYPAYGTEPRRLLHLLEHLGIPNAGDGLEFPIRDEEWRTAVTLQASFGLRSSEYVCLHPGARAANRRWSPQGFAEVADAVAQRGVRVVLTGIAEEAGIVDAVAHAMHHDPVNLTGRTHYGELAALLAGARLLICNDTGVSHLAAAIGVPSVVIYTGSSPERWAPANRERHRAVYRLTEGSANTEGITAQQVIREAEKLL